MEQYSHLHKWYRLHALVKCEERRSQQAHTLELGVIRALGRVQGGSEGNFPTWDIWITCMVRDEREANTPVNMPAYDLGTPQRGSTQDAISLQRKVDSSLKPPP